MIVILLVLFFDRDEYLNSLNIIKIDVNMIVKWVCGYIYRGFILL